MAGMERAVSYRGDGKAVYRVAEARPVVVAPPAAQDWSSHRTDSIILDNGQPSPVLGAPISLADRVLQAPRRSERATRVTLHPAWSSTMSALGTATGSSTASPCSLARKPTSTTRPELPSNPPLKEMSSATLTRWCTTFHPLNPLSRSTESRQHRNTCSTMSFTNSAFRQRQSITPSS